MGGACFARNNGPSVLIKLRDVAIDERHDRTVDLDDACSSTSSFARALD
jgi:hypothetical protein